MFKILLKNNVQGLPLENIVFLYFTMIVDWLVLKKNVNLSGSWTLVTCLKMMSLDLTLQIKLQWNLYVMYESIWSKSYNTMCRRKKQLSLVINESTNRTMEQHLILYYCYSNLKWKGAAIVSFVEQLAIKDFTGDTVYFVTNNLLEKLWWNTNKLVASIGLDSITHHKCASRCGSLAWKVLCFTCFKCIKTFRFKVLTKWWRSPYKYVKAMVGEIEHKIWINGAWKWCTYNQVACVCRNFEARMWKQIIVWSMPILLGHQQVVYQLATSHKKFGKKHL